MNCVQRDEMFGVLKLHLKRMFSFKMADWLCCNWRVVDEQHIKLMKYLVLHPSDKDADLLSLSLAVMVDDIPSYVRFTIQFFETKASSLLLTSVAKRPK